MLKYTKLSIYKRNQHILKKFCWTKMILSTEKKDHLEGVTQEMASAAVSVLPFIHHKTQGFHS